jgi:hypothetical protein
MLMRSTDAPIADVLAGCPGEGVAGALYCLILGDVLEIAPASSEVALRAEPTRAMLTAVSKRITDSDYFGILGVRPDVTGRELRQTYLRRRDGFRSIELTGPDSDDLVVRRDAIVDALDEAFEILEDDDLRSAYRGSLGL